MAEEIKTEKDLVICTEANSLLKHRCQDANLNFSTPEPNLWLLFLVCQFSP
jgi:hypothetical protein